MISKIVIFTITMVVIMTVSVESTDQSATLIGSFYGCAHQLRGDIWVQNDRQIFIQGFNYDGAGPTAWFHGQLRPASGIHTSDPNDYVTLPFPGPSCDRLRRRYTNENVSLTLPRSIKDFETIGVFCYRFCSNFGHVVIPADLVVSPAPEVLDHVKDCQQPDQNPCRNPRNGNLKPQCGVYSAVGNKNGIETSVNVRTGYISTGASRNRSIVTEGVGSGARRNVSTVVETTNNRSGNKGTGNTRTVRLTKLSEEFIELLVTFVKWLREVY